MIAPERLSPRDTPSDAARELLGRPAEVLDHTGAAGTFHGGGNNFTGDLAADQSLLIESEGSSAASLTVLSGTQCAGTITLTSTGSQTATITSSAAPIA